MFIRCFQEISKRKIDERNFEKSYWDKLLKETQKETQKENNEYIQMFYVELVSAFYFGFNFFIYDLGQLGRILRIQVTNVYLFEVLNILYIVN